MRFSTLATTAVVSSTCASAFPTIAKRDYDNSTKGLNDYAKADGKLYFGTASDNGDGSWQDESYITQLDNTHDFGQLTPANLMKWFATEPERDVFNFTGGDEVVARADTNGQIVRCHNLIWHSQLPDWLSTGTWDNATLISIMENHINGLVDHWGASCVHWDVLNEALNDDGTYRESIFYNTTGPAYISLAFQFAAAALERNDLGDKVKLYYNDYNIEKPSAKSTAAAKIVTDLQAQGIRIDGVGLQSHFVVGGSPSYADQVANMQSFTALGVEVAITELDVRFESLPPTADGLAQQVTDYTNTVAACKDVEGCVGITLWDFSDKYSWIPQTFKGQGSACPWDDNNEVKPQVYQAIVTGLTEDAEG